MSTLPAPPSLPPVRTASRYRSRRMLPAAALVISIVLHALLLVATPVLIGTFRAPPSMKFDAVLVPLKAIGPAPIAATAQPKAPRPKRAAPAIRPSAAQFTPPNNAIAVNAPEPLPPALEPLNAEPMPDIALAELKPLPAPPALQSLPSRIGITYKITSSLADGTATFNWKRDGAQYEIESTIRADGIFASMFVGTIRQASRGAVTAQGLRPAFFSLLRGGGEPETAEFLRDTNELRMKSRGDTQLVPLAGEMQDMQSFLFQMATEAPRLRGTGASLDVLVTNARKVYLHQFKLVGEEIVTMRNAPVAVLHLRSDAVDPEDVYEAWLAPQYLYLPVKLKFFMGRFPVEQTATNIGVSPE